MGLEKMAQWVKQLAGQTWESEFESPVPMQKAGYGHVWVCNPSAVTSGDRRIVGTC